MTHAGCCAYPSPPHANTIGEMMSNPATDYVFRTRKLDQLEEACANVITQQTWMVDKHNEEGESELHFHGTQNLGVFSLRFSRTLEIDVAEEGHDGGLAFVMATKGSGYLTVDNLQSPVSTQEGVFVTSDQQRIFRYPYGCTITALLMDRRKVASHCAKLLGHELGEDLSFKTAFDFGADTTQSWHRLMQYAIAELSDPQSLVRNIEPARLQFEQMLMNGVLFAQSHNYSDTLLKPHPSVAPFYVKRAEAFIEANFAEQISLADIAAHVGVSARSLQNGFQNFRRTTPMAFLRTVRLQRVHQDLLAADPESETVTRIAMQAGFNHMGEFATQYRRTFDATPSQTLARWARG